MSYSNEPPNYGTPPPPPGGYGGGQGGYGGGQGGYGDQGGYGGAQPQQTSVMAIISLVTGILGVLCCGSLIFSVAAIILGYLGKKETDSGQKSGGGMALAGLILGGVGVVLSIIWIILWITTGSFNFYSDI
ncbi:DUF4190 domain-containing protein [Nocardioides sp. SYSU DS0651]|uniref:DUF4190 domain-containing protein n=1 Tax=Nocardioides sp. SYSU DS0651 TaxID=3415955 RepID=UPI003F4B4701